MPNRNTVIFQKSLLAIAVVSLSACTSTPRIQDYDLSRVGAGILSAGRTTAEVSSHVWDRTTYLLGFNDGEAQPNESQLMDEVDVAMMEEDAIMPDNAIVSPIVIEQASRTTDQTPTNAELLQQDQTPISLDDGIDNANAPNEVTANADNQIVVEDLIHEVKTNETLWDISKLTTGDATNWHLLADVNNLGPNAAVFPGQRLIVPADMVKPDYDDVVADVVANTQQAETPILINTQDLTDTTNKTDSKSVDENASTDTQRLAIPATNESTELATAQSAGQPFKLNAGETLWDFAKRTTGDATNWQAIAGQNNFTEKQAVLVRAGQTIYVPKEMVRPELDVADNTVQKLDVADNTNQTPTNAPEQAVELAAADPTSENANQQAITATSNLLASASALDETQSIKIVEATFKPDESREPINVESAITDALTSTVGDSEQIMVSGTYYPKAIYNDADFSSSLLMRVSPGTTLQVSKAMGNWFEVTTDKGVGYVHQRDIK